MRAGRRTRTGVVGLAAAAVAVTALATPARAGDEGGTPERQRGGSHQLTQRAMDALVASGIPGVTTHARDARGAWKGASGVGNLRTQAPRGTGDHFRIASITKTFVATVLLQMEAEGRLDLDDTVERWLPGLVRGHGHDGRTMTVRQLLNHTSGVFDYAGDPEYNRKYISSPAFMKHRFETRSPLTAVRIAMTHPPTFPPGAAYQYSNTNYVLAGLVIEAVGGRDYEREVERRIIGPLGLRSTVMPRTDPRMPGPSGRAYTTFFSGPPSAGQKVYDVTLQNPTQSWADGDMISTAADLNRFLSALLGGRLLAPAQLKAMKDTVPNPRDPNSSYGLGLEATTIGCGITLWGHSGGWPGSLSNAVATEDGRHTLAYNINGDWLDQNSAGLFIGMQEAQFCGKDVTKGDQARGGGTAERAGKGTAVLGVPVNRAVPAP
ncbi:serine hydrolase domain-containing protein [Streptomyces sp. NPDC057638]|uniref:serine hydrolase domain-containing protein n=1 Tax=Streptomyces sp. NPDC057638 TaxID=3346190 RepID=UPI00367640B9